MTTQQFWTSTWRFNPWVIAVCVIALFVYARAVRFRFSPRSNYFVAAVMIFFLTLTSPVNALADGYLFSAHMLQHLLLLLVIPPLVLLGLPQGKTNSARSMMNSSAAANQPNAEAQETHSTFRVHPFGAWLAGLGAMWIWHERTLCDFATTTLTGKVLQTSSLLVLGTLFWSPIVGPQLSRRLPPLLGVVYLFTACVGCTILGILITFAPVGVVCPVYLHPVDSLGILPLIRQQWGITPALDQQAGGLMMWVPACGIYITGVITLLARWYRNADAKPNGNPTIPAEFGPELRTARTHNGNA